MTEFDIQEELFGHFLTLNEFCGIEYLVRGTDGGYLNVHFPNVQFTPPADKRWFELAFINAEPADASIMEGAQYRFAGIMRIDIITPQDCGEDEVMAKYRWIARLFNGAELDIVDIMKVYISTRGNDADHYRLQVTVEWSADISKE